MRNVCAHVRAHLNIHEAGSSLLEDRLPSQVALNLIQVASPQNRSKRQTEC